METSVKEDLVTQTDSDALGDAYSPQMKLTWDILLQVLDCIDLFHNNDRSRMMRSCRTLYAPSGISDLVKGGVRISLARQFSYFCSFMLRHKAHTFQHLHKLSLSFTYKWQTLDKAIAENLSKLISHMFKRCTELHTLEFWPTPGFFSDDRISRAVASLPSLHKLSLRDIADDASNLLSRQFKAPVKKIEGSFEVNWAEDGGDPVPLFKSFRRSLQELDISWVELDSIDIQYLHLTSLTIQFNLGVDAETLYSAFPNLRYLSIYEAEEQDKPDMIEILRERNLDFQEGGNIWDSLDYFDTNLTLAYILGFQSTIEHLSLCGSDLTAKHQHYLSTIMEDARPTAVSLQFSLPEFDPSVLRECLFLAQNSLLELSLNIRLHGDDYEDPTPTLKTLLSALSQSQIEHLHISMEWSYHRLSPIFDITNDPEFDDVVHMDLHVPRRPEDPLNDMGHEALAREAAQCIPSLRNLCLTAQGYPGQHHWEIKSGVDGERVIAPLLKSQGKAAFEQSILYRSRKRTHEV